MAIVIAILVYTVALSILFMTVEFMHISKGHSSWKWIENLYKKHECLQKVKW